MRHLNYNHLHYFWVVAREGTIARAAEVLHVTPQTISGQLKLLDEAVGDQLFERSGRRLVLSGTGQTIFEYADDIFAIGAELAQVARAKKPGAMRRLRVGVVDSVPKLVTARMLAPAFELEEPPRIRCVEGSLGTLLGSLAVHRLDLILSDQPVSSSLNVRAYNQPLGVSAVGFFAHRSVAARYRRNFPQSLDGAPLLLPGESSPIRRRLEDWLEQQGIAVNVAAEFDDSALMKAFGLEARGVFVGPVAMADEVGRMYESRLIGEASEVTEHFYAITPERRLKHLAVIAITESAKNSLFA